MELLEVSDNTWPNYIESLTIDNEVTIAIQINGKLRATIDIIKDIDKEEVENIVKSNNIVKKYIDGKSIKKFIFVPNKLVNLVIG